MLSKHAATCSAWRGAHRAALLLRGKQERRWPGARPAASLATCCFELLCPGQPPTGWASCDRGHAEERSGERCLAQEQATLKWLCCFSGSERKSRGKEGEPGPCIGAGIPAGRCCGVGGFVGPSSSPHPANTTLGPAVTQLPAVCDKKC